MPTQITDYYQPMWCKCIPNWMVYDISVERQKKCIRSTANNSLAHCTCIQWIFQAISTCLRNWIGNKWLHNCNMNNEQVIGNSFNVLNFLCLKQIHYIYSISTRRNYINDGRAIELFDFKLCANTFGNWIWF